MFLFPLGLDAKTRRFPFVCVAIVIGTCMYSFVKFDRQNEESKRHLQSPATQEFYRARVALVAKNCEVAKLSSDACEILQQDVDTTKAVHLMKLGRNIEDAANQKFVKDKYDKSGQKRAAKVANEISKALFEEGLFKKASSLFPASAELDFYTKAQREYEEERIKVHQKNNTLAKSNLNLRSLLEAQITHAGWAHLIGNMIFFLILGIPVEERFGPLAFLICYVIGGFFGLLGQVHLFDSSVQGLLGASANVSAIAGAFLALFARNKMRIWMSAAFMYNRVLLIPSWIFIPLFVVMSDVTGTMESGSNVAHIAHLGGFICGFMIGLVWKQVAPLPKGYVFPFELSLLNEAKTLAGERRLIPLAQLLFYHRENVEAQELAVETMVAEGIGSWRLGTKPSRVQNFLINYFPTIFNRKLESNEPNQFVHFVSRLPADWPLQEITDEVNIEKLRHAAYAAESTDQKAALRLFQILARLTYSNQEKAELTTRIQQLQQREVHAAV